MAEKEKVETIKDVVTGLTFGTLTTGHLDKIEEWFAKNPDCKKMDVSEAQAIINALLPIVRQQKEDIIWFTNELANK